MNKTILLILFMILNSYLFSQSGTLIVNIVDVEGDNGNIKVALYNKKGESGFLKTLETSFDKKIAYIKNGQSTVAFNNIPYGVYAVSVFHDKNNNGELELAPIGFPMEPYGVSGNKTSIGPPSFNGSKFELNSKKKTITIKLKSFKKN